MMGNKKLSVIREEIRAALSKDGLDPIAWLDAQISSAKRQGREDTDVLESIKRSLEAVPKRNGHGKSARPKK